MAEFKSIKRTQVQQVIELRADGRSYVAIAGLWRSWTPIPNLARNVTESKFFVLLGVYPGISRHSNRPVT